MRNNQRKNPGLAAQSPKSFAGKEKENDNGYQQ
jgi:hypothetical protein